MFSNKSAGLFSWPTRYVMVAASRLGSTSAVMRLSSPIASTFCSQTSRSLELDGRATVLDGGSCSRAFGMLTLMSMVDLTGLDNLNEHSRSPCAAAIAPARVHSRHAGSV